jgi:hypothetical protein
MEIPYGGTDATTAPSDILVGNGINPLITDTNYIMVK